MIYPLSSTRYIWGSIWSAIDRDKKTTFIYNSNYVSKPTGKLHYELFTNQPKILISILDSKDDTLLQSQLFNPKINYDYIFQEWDINCGRAYEGMNRMINGLDLDKYSKNPLILYQNEFETKIRVKDIKKLKNIKIEWIQD